MVKRLFSIVIAILIFSSSFLVVGKGDTNYNEHLRGVWVCTVVNLDWPSRAAMDTVDDNARIKKSKQELIKILDRALELNLNAIFFQVSPSADALYKSDIVPWSRYLTGTLGKDPGFDPLEFVISESRKRDLEVHAWFNPYRVSLNTTSQTRESLDVEKSVYKENPPWIRIANSRFVVDPGIPEVKEWAIARVMEVVENYDIDGVHFDDYFYYESYFGDLDDEKTFEKYNNGRFDNIKDWRRNNTYTLIKMLSEELRRVNSKIKFGISPSGIWSNKSDEQPEGSNTQGGFTNFDQCFADTKKWVEEELIDYIAPQLYYSFENPRAPYEELARWWQDVVKGKDVHLYIGNALYKVNDDADSAFLGNRGVEQIQRQLDLNFKLKGVNGTILFRAQNLFDDGKAKAVKNIQENVWSTKSIIPNMDWKSNNISLYFEDVGISHDWAALAIDFLYEKKIIKGDHNGHFNPYKKTTRADFVIMLVNSLNLNENFSKNFVDIDKNAYYYNHIGMAKSLGLIKGDGEFFYPENNITREDIMVIITNSLDSLGLTLEESLDLNLVDYDDYETISDYAKNAVNILTRAGVVRGYDGKIGPKDYATRAQCAVMLYGVSF